MSKKMKLFMFVPTDIILGITGLLNYNGDKNFKDEISSNIEEVKRIIDNLREFIKKHVDNFDETILIGCHEIIVNSVEHGNCFDRKKKVIVIASIGKGYFKVEIEDEGNGFPWQDYLYKEHEPSLDERGRGLMIARETFDYIVYNNKGNKVTLFKLF